jgi:chromosome segregation protein
MEESGVSKLISVRLEHGELAKPEEEDEDPSQQGLWEEEEVESEEGRELPPGVNDPAKVTEEQLRPITARTGK